MAHVSYWKIFMFPPSREHDPSLHIDLWGNKLTDVAGASVLSPFLSIASWLDDTQVARDKNQHHQSRTGVR
jgi:hypothetical protein